jgi:hypothetical protein
LPRLSMISRAWMSMIVLIRGYPFADDNCAAV